MSSTFRSATFAAIAAALILTAWSQAVDAETAPEETAPLPAPLPVHLRETGLYAEGRGLRIDPKNLAFSPQYPLWSDAARKRRWIYLPPGTAIDASRPDAWEFPRGTRLWKEFSLDRPIETRFIERLADGTWRYATYVWNEEGTDATLAPTDGIAALPRQGAPDGHYSVPAEGDCRACHEGAAVPVLGFGALQLSSDRDPLAPHAEPGGIDLRDLVAHGLVKNLPPALLNKPPRIAARSAAERASLGYLHGNCAHCHNDNGAPAPVDLTLAQSVTAGAHGAERVLRTMVNAGARYRAQGLSGGSPVIAPGRPDESVLIARVRSRNPQTQMPPLGTRMLDKQALTLLERWICEQSHTPEELKP